MEQASFRDFLDLFMFTANNKKGFGKYNLAKAGGGFRNFYKGLLFSLLLLFSLPSSDDFSHFLLGLTKSAGSKAYLLLPWS